MVSKVSETSLEALEKYVEYFGETQEGNVFEYILRHPHMTRNEISIDTDIKLNAVCGRVNSLIKKGLVREGEKRLDNYNNTNVRAFTLHNKDNIDWNLIDLNRKQELKEKQKDPLYKYANIIAALINNFEKNNNKEILILLENDNENLKDLFTLKKIVGRINKKYEL